MAIEQVVEKCTLESFSNLFLTEKEWGQKAYEQKGIKGMITNPFISEGILAKNLEKKDIFGLRFYRVFAIKKTKDLVHAFIGIHKRRLFTKAYNGTHIFASQHGENLILKFVHSTEYYKLRFFGAAILGLLFFFIPALIIMLLYGWLKKKGDKFMSSKTIPAILESLGQPETETVK